MSDLLQCAEVVGGRELENVVSRKVLCGREIPPPDDLSAWETREADRVRCQVAVPSTEARRRGTKQALNVFEGGRVVGRTCNMC